MKKNLPVCATALTFLALLTIPSRISAQQPRYKLIDMGTFGGPHAFLNDGNGGNNSVSILNNRGAVVGWANTKAPDPFPSFCFDDGDCFVSHAFQWTNEVLTDLGALDSGLSSQAAWISQSGLIAGTSQNGEIDPLLAGFPEFRAVLWRQGDITNLGTLPEGFESSANAVNSKGEVIGWATNSTPDANSMAGPRLFPTQTRAFLWKRGTIQDLGTLGTGTDAIAQFINERGQIVGWSYTGESQANTCNPNLFPLPTHSFIWDEERRMRDLGTLGGTCAIATGINNRGIVIGDNVNDQSLERAFFWKDEAIQDLGGSIGGQQTGAAGINDSGQVAGFATLAGEVLFHAVLWKRVGEITDLGALGADECSFATGINSKTQVVGGSAVGCVFDSQSHAVLWEHGSIFDLNDLVAPGATLTLELAQGINDRGEIAGIGVDASGNQHAYVLVPCDDNSSDCEEGLGEAAAARPAPITQLPPQIKSPAMRRMLHQRIPPLPHISRSAGLASESPKDDTSSPSSCTNSTASTEYRLDDQTRQFVSAQNWGTCTASYWCSAQVTSCRFCGDICPLMHMFETCWDLKYHRSCHRCA